MDTWRAGEALGSQPGDCPEGGQHQRPLLKQDTVTGHLQAGTWARVGLSSPFPSHQSLCFNNKLSWPGQRNGPGCHWLSTWSSVFSKGHLLWAKACPGCWTGPRLPPPGTELKAEMAKKQALTAQCDEGSEEQPRCRQHQGQWGQGWGIEDHT